MLGRGRLAMGLAASLVVASMAQGFDGGPRAERLLALHFGDAVAYSIYRDAARTEKLELRREPIYRWSNPTRVGGQEGDVFVWTDEGRPEVVASTFSHPHDDHKNRVGGHELHSLSEAVLVVDRVSPNRWEPKAPGVDLKPVPGAPTPAETRERRGVQFRAIARDFSGRSLSDSEQTWELRLLPRSVYQHEGTGGEVIEGALFALVSNAGTDPEIILLVEAKRSPEGPRRVFDAARFSDMSLWLKHEDREVWGAIRGPENTFCYDAKHRFRFYQDRFVPEIEASAADPEKAEAK